MSRLLIYKSMTKAEKILNEVSDQSVKGYNDNKPYYWHNFTATAQKKELIEKTINLKFCGWDTEEEKKEENKEAIALLDYARKSFKNAQEIADVMIDAHTFGEINWREELKGDCSLISKLDKLMDEYEGLDAYVFCAQLEYAHNIHNEDYITVEEAIKIFS